MSGKTAATAALAASQTQLLPSAGKKRKPKAAAVSPDPHQQSGKKRKVDSGAADESTPNGTKSKGVGSSSKRPPRAVQEELDTPSGQVQKLKVRLGSAAEVSHSHNSCFTAYKMCKCKQDSPLDMTCLVSSGFVGFVVSQVIVIGLAESVQGKLSRLGRQAANQGQKSSGKRPAPSPAASSAASEGEGDDEDDEEREEEAYKAGDEAGFGRRTRRASAARDAAPASRRKSKSKHKVRVYLTLSSTHRQVDR